MKFANNNKAIINKLTRRSAGANKLRNIFAVAAIVLTTVLFTSLFTIGMGMVETMEQQTMRQAGGSAHGTFKYLTEEEFKNIKDHPSIKESGYSIMVGMGENKELSKHHTEVRYADINGAKMLFSYPNTGKMPQKEDEIATGTAVLDLLKLPHKTGEKVVIEYGIGQNRFRREFILSGFWESDPVSPASMVLVSREFIDKNLAGIDVDNADKKGMGTGLIFLDVMFKSSLDIEQRMERVLNDRGYSSDENAPNFIASGVNWAYLSTNFNFDFTFIVSLLAAGLLIIFTGYLIIYNIFQISVIRDIRFYGLLKTIGTTPRQIKRLVRNQALLLSAVGIPIGLILGYITGNVLLPVIISGSNLKRSYISFSPVIFTGAALFSIVTIYISCRKPGIIASRVSPVEAVRYIDAADYKGREEKKSSRGGKIYNMALSNILRNRKKTALVVVSLSLSLILLNCVFTFTRSFDMDKYLERFVTTDFTAANANYFNTLKSFNSENDTVSEEMIKSIDELQGIEDSGRIYYNLKQSSTVLEGRETYIQLYGLEDFPLSCLKVFEGELDLEKLKSGNYIIEAVDSDDNGNIRCETSKYNIGDRVSVTYENNVTKEYEIMAKAELKHNMSVRYYLMGSLTMYLPSEEFKDKVENPLTMSYIFNAEDDKIENVERFLQDYTTKTEPQMDYESKQKYGVEFKSFQNIFLLVGGALSFVIGIIGVLNFINAMLTSIISRRREFAMLQSIGMTNRQLNSMLLLEGLFYALSTSIISLVFGSLLSLFAVRPIIDRLWFTSYRFTLLPVLAASPVLIVISLLVPMASYISVNKQTIVERLREAE